MDVSDKLKFILTAAPILLIPLFKWLAKQRSSAPLFNAVIQGDVDAVKRLIAKQVFVDTKDTLGMTPLMYASIEGRTEIVRLLAGKGANVHVQSVTGMTALMYAEANGHDSIAQLLREAGAIH